MIGEFTGEAERGNQRSIFVKVKGREYEIPVDVDFDRSYNVPHDGIVEIDVTVSGGP